MCPGFPLLRKERNHRRISPDRYSERMKQLITAFALLTLNTAGAQVISEVQLRKNGQELGQTTAYLLDGHIMLPLTAFATMGWKPLLDTDNHIVDVAACLRISLVKRKMWLIGSPPTLGVHSASPIAELPTPPQLRAGRWYLPAKAVLNQLQHTVIFDKATGRLNVIQPTDPPKINPNVEACLANLPGN